MAIDEGSFDMTSVYPLLTQTILSLLYIFYDVFFIFRVNWERIEGNVPLLDMDTICSIYPFWDISSIYIYKTY